MSDRQPNILIAEDDGAIREGLCDLLRSDGFQVLSTEDGVACLQALEREGPFKLIILDIMMPGKSGFEVCREIRRTDAHTPILFLTAKGEELDKVLGLELGADDYLTKPFGLRECLARVHALLRRSALVGEGAGPGDPSLEALPPHFLFAAAHIDYHAYTATLPGRVPESLTAQEMKLIGIFRQNAEQVLTRDHLLNLGWGIDYYGTTRTLDQHVAQLRKKCELDSAHPEYLRTLHGVGYRYCDEGLA